MRISDGVQTCALPIYITDGTDELRARPLANQKAFGFPRENNRHYDQHDPDQDRTRAVPPRIACDQRSSDSGSRSEEHTSELQSLMRTSYAVFCLKKKNTTHTQAPQNQTLPQQS